MKLAEQAFNELFPEKNLEEYQFEIKYTDRFKPYNANVRYRKNSLQFNLSKKWRTVSKEIQIGLIQGLMLRVFKEKDNTINIDLYNHFMRNLHISAPKTNTDPILEKSFDKINEKYFFGFLETPNLAWHNSIRRLGSYEYGSDTISISRVLLEDSDLMDYVIYHEMLHKKFKFSSSNGRTCHHTREFKEMERKFDNSMEMEQRIKRIGKKRKRLFSFI
ncbi:SprT-like domain-containing protein [Candidatus Woesearchaeota archaeon]|nr:SprT-like domain-containing protein [Candidatus Woesearchaeota archaeon]